MKFGEKNIKHEKNKLIQINLKLIEYFKGNIINKIIQLYTH